MQKLKTVFNLLRVKQYVKNLFIFAPLIFAQEFRNIDKIELLIISFVAFSFIASFIYIINDILDKIEDEKHPVKKYRAIPSGLVSVRSALGTAVVLLLSGITISFLFVPQILPIIGFYVVINLLYSRWLKHISLIDIVVVAICYVVRLFVGATAADVVLSPWIIIMTFLLAIFLAIAKRRDDLKYENVRTCIASYNRQFIDVSMSMTASVIIICYIIYTISPEVTGRFGCDYLYITSIFVFLGILRYLQIVLIEDNGYSPTEIYLKDRVLKLIIFLWIATFIGMIY